jgi:hypothetical protein
MQKASLAFTLASVSVCLDLGPSVLDSVMPIEAFSSFCSDTPCGCHAVHELCLCIVAHPVDVASMLLSMLAAQPHVDTCMPHDVCHVLCV